MLFYDYIQWEGVLFLFMKITMHNRLQLTDISGVWFTATYNETKCYKPITVMHHYPN